MTAAYVPVKGDRIRRADWSGNEYMDVDYVGRSIIVGIDWGGNEMTASRYNTLGEWIKVEAPAPLTQKWGNFYPNGAAHFYDTKEIADTYADKTRIALVHIWTDADGVDRIERVTS